MVMQTIPKKRCAIYTRKSVEEGLDQEFNSLDAQREAGEAYIASQKANGWVCLPTRYDDGGYSGGNMKRPALQQLLADCEAGLVDIIVVYKIDRLSRSICDFADLSKKFDEWGTQFVAVTQEINTATSAGRMMLNILITFAQYEREVITERVRDKMSASRKKGKWVGGRVPMGYRVENKKLTIVEEEARIIQRIFQRFIEVQSPALIAQELNKDGIRTKQGRIWNRQHIYRILSNHTYVGKVNYKNSVCDGEQEAIIDQDVWDRTREILRVNDPAPAHMPRTEIIAPLKGILRCGHCDCAMMPTYARKGRKQYYYYFCAKDSKRATPTCPVRQIPAGDVERITREQVMKMLQTPTILIKLAQVLNLPAEKIAELFKETFWQEISPGEMNRLLHLLLEKVEVHEGKLTVEFKSSGIKTLMEEIANGEETD